MANRGVGVLFGGVDDFISIGDQPNLDLGAGDFTVRAWLRTTSGANLTIGSKGDTGKGWSFYVNSGIGSNLTFLNRAGANKFTYGTTPVNTGNWVHAVCTRVGAVGKVYLNGADDTFSTGDMSANVNTAGEPFYIGAREFAGAPGVFMDGTLDGVTILRGKAWSLAEVQADFNAGVGTYITADADTEGIWGLDEGSGIATADRSGNGYSGVLTNFPTNGTNWVAGVIPTPVAPQYALSFGGVDEYIDMGDQPNLDFGAGDFTVMVFNRHPIAAPTITDETLASKGDDVANKGWSFFIDNATGELRFKNEVTSAETEGTTDIMASGWRAVAFRRQAGVGRVFLDGVDDTNVPGSGDVSGDVASAGEPFRVGATSAATFMIGQSTKISVWNRGLTDAEIADLLTYYVDKACVFPSTLVLMNTNLQGSWLINDGIGALAVDDSDNGYDGTITNMENIDWLYGVQLLAPPVPVPPIPPVVDVDQFKVGRAYRRFSKTRVK